MSKPKATPIQIDLVGNLHKWMAFLAVAELRSLTRAALHLDSNQSMLSRQINALERECNARLFVRTGRGVELSDVGQRIFPQVKSLLAEAERLEVEIRGEARLPSGQVTLGLLPSLTQPLIGELYSRLHKRFPDIRLRVLEGSNGQVEEWLADARVDVAILYRYGPTLPETEVALARVDSYLVGRVGDSRTAGQQVPFRALDGLPFVLPGPPNGLRHALDALARREHIILEAALEVDSLPLFKSLVAEQNLYTVLPLHAVWKEVQARVLQAALIVDPPLQRTVAMAEARNKGPNQSVRTVVGLVTALFREFADQGLWLPSPLAAAA
jgi:DNA-binding transcriptional LysR family regulator